MSRWIASGVVVLLGVWAAFWASGPGAPGWSTDATGRVWQVGASLELLRSVEGFRSPALVCMAGDGGAWVVDRLSEAPPWACEIVRLGPVGQRLFAVAGFGGIVGIAPVVSGGLWVADRAQGELLRLSEGGDVADRWQLPGLTSVRATGPGDRVVVATDRGRVLFLQPEQRTPLEWQVGGRPIDVAPAPEEGIWVLDGNYPTHLIRLDRSGSELLRVPTYLSAERLAIDAQSGAVWVASTTEPLVHCYRIDGALRFAVETPVAGMRGLVVDDRGRCWLSARDRLLRIAADGKSIDEQAAVERSTDVAVP